MTVRNESNFLAEIAHVPDDHVVFLGVTAGEGRRMLERPADPDGATFMPDVQYSADAGEVGQMAVYRRTDTTERAPIVLAVHGGAWSSGHHYGEIRYVHPLAAMGYVTATATYRLSTEAAWPAAIQDVKAALRWLREHAHELGGDPDRIVLCGGSAGGHLVLLAALTPGRDEPDGDATDDPSAVQGIYLLSPAVDLGWLVGEPGGEVYAEYFGDDLSAADPRNLDLTSCPPVLTITGSEDVIAPLHAVTAFHERLGAAGVPHRLEVLDGRVHGLDLVPVDFETCLGLLREFVPSVVGPAAEDAGRR